MRFREESNVVIAIEYNGYELGALRFSYEDTCWKFHSYTRDGITQKQSKKISKELKRLNGMDD